ncbi:MAG TPA: preprotein translocase subunit SecY [Candidatus Azoamicus sp. OHIO2]
MYNTIHLSLFNWMYCMNDLKRRIIFVIFILIIYRIGAHIPIPLIDTKQIINSFSDINKNIFSLFNLFSGGALAKITIFSLGIMPYISSSIVIQLLSAVWMPLKNIQKDGQHGKKKLSNYTRLLTLLLATIQASAMATFLITTSASNSFNTLHHLVIILSLITGTLFLMWLGEQINEKGIGNGISLIIFTSIISNIPRSIVNAMEKLRQGEIGFLLMLIFIISIILIIILIIIIERAQRKIFINYPKRQQGRKIYAAQTNYLPFKINMASVLPPIFASSVILFPITIIKWINNTFKLTILDSIVNLLAPGNILYIILFSAFIAFFSFFYTNLIFNSTDTADNLKKTGGFISGIRPGEQTSTYINKIINKLTYIGTVYLCIVCIIPELLVFFANIPFYFGGTSLLIIVVVIMDFISQVQGRLISQKYDALLKKNKYKKY